MIIELAGGAGSGKTEIIKNIVRNIVLDYNIAIVNVKPVNIKGEFDKYGAKVIEVNTGDDCLGYNNFKILEEELSDYDIIFLEHPGTYLCKFLSDGIKMAVLSACDGRDVVKKYPYIFQFADIIVITKTDICDEKELKERLMAITSCKNVIPLQENNFEELIVWIKKLL